MKMHDYNPSASKAAILIHPMLSSAQGVRECLPELWSDDVRWLLPDLSAHGDAVAETYQSAADEAKAIHDYLLEHGCTHLQLSFGASLGGVVLFELLKYSI